MVFSVEADGYKVEHCANCGGSAIRKRPAKFCSDSCRWEYNKSKPTVRHAVDFEE